VLGKVSDEFRVKSDPPPGPRGLKSFLGFRLLVVPAVLLTSLLAPPARAADPFYMRLLRQGTDAFNRHDYQTAARELRLACFGFLDEPPLLADGLTRLALAQASTGDEAGFRETFQRLTEVEERFQAYSRADIPKDVRAAFESLVVQAIPRATLSANPAFARLVPTPYQTVANLPPAQRRKELNRLIKSEPTEVRWRLMLADLELSDGNVREASKAADAALKLAPGNREALKLRGLALVADKKWAQAESDLKACGLASSDPKVAGALLTCLVELKRWQEASDFTAKLPSDVANDRVVQQMSTTAALEVRASQAGVAPTPTRAVAAGAKAAGMTAAGTTVAAGGAAAGPLRTPTPRPAERSAAPTVAAGSGQPSATGAASKAVVSTSVVAVAAVASTPTPAPRPTSRPAATGAIASATGQSASNPPKGPMSAAEKAELDRARDLANAGNLDAALAIARKIADAHPDLAEPQFVTAEIAYRTSRWKEAVAYFRRGGDPGDGRPLLLFYDAVALYESGDRAGAAVPLKRCLPNIRHTPFVEEYTKKILGNAAPVTQKP
jgi:tetratricopeptide (TPR) repeat protein